MPGGCECVSDKCVSDAYFTTSTRPTASDVFIVIIEPSPLGALSGERSFSVGLERKVVHKWSDGF